MKGDVPSSTMNSQRHPGPLWLSSLAVLLAGAITPWRACISPQQLQSARNQSVHNNIFMQNKQQVNHSYILYKRWAFYVLPAWVKSEDSFNTHTWKQACHISTFMNTVTPQMVSITSYHHDDIILNKQIK